MNAHIFATRLASMVLVVASAGLQPVISAQNSHSNAADKPMRFEVASMRPVPEGAMRMYSMSPPGETYFTVRTGILTYLIMWAFDLDSPDQISGKPDWLDRQRYDITAKPEGTVGLNYEQIKPLLQQLLRDRLHLQFHLEPRKFKGYALLVAKGGPKLTVSKGDSAPHAEWGGGPDAEIYIRNSPASSIALMMQPALGEHVVDETGLKGNFDCTLHYAPPEETNSRWPSLFTATEEQLGLRLEKKVLTLNVMLIDHIDRVATED